MIISIFMHMLIFFNSIGILNKECNCLDAFVTTCGLTEKYSWKIKMQERNEMLQPFQTIYCSLYTFRKCVAWIRSLLKSLKGNQEITTLNLSLLKNTQTPALSQGRALGYREAIMLA